ncbi:MAG: hypothetical protein WCA27_22445 [Candidatus Sulfotelmatobacter sp.]
MTTVNAALQILATATKFLNAIRERVAASSDPEAKALVNEMYDQMAALKEAVGRVTDENAELRRRTAQLENPAEAKPRPKIRQVGAVNYYFVGDEGPYCQACYDDKRKLVALSPAEEWNRGVRRQCTVCKNYFYEKPMDFSSVRRRSWRGR